MGAKRWAGAVTLAMAVALALGIYGAGLARSAEPPTTQEVSGKTAGCADCGPGPGRVVKTMADGGISVSGEGSVDGRPDTAYINLGFQARNTSLSAAQQEAARKMNDVLTKIGALGVAEKDIQTSNYDIYREEQHDVFVVSNSVSVTVRNIGSAGELLDRAVAAGANSVNGISFGIEDRTALEKQARETAMAAARSKAAELARLGGVKLGKPVSISEGTAPPPPVMYEMARAAAPADAATPIEPGQMKVTINVQVKYAIQ